MLMACIDFLELLYLKFYHTNENLNYFDKENSKKFKASYAFKFHPKPSEIPIKI